ncbi:DUF1624 domain-containing protein [Sulfidibacter corallicola]|uniref:DUF1624 domain-containing protein n=1 Tax=Sulfidibacter corallicola TaxID=2818388 RepID=A0A8A4TJY5_SULCO|nr:heparan-alpha-glucosaminide N-acetyltransferase domain-containing protein [Sulfidibacter corallicola]QTD49181.1 DUF1624 domain-containing protein [Sulfidibacter corallicola]
MSHSPSEPPASAPALEMPDSPLDPVHPSRPAKRRIEGYDVARALAVLGMILVNYKVVLVAQGSNACVWLTGFASLFEGRAAATFVILAGVGMSLMTARARASREPTDLGRARITLLRRALFLFVGGMLYTPLWPADILHFYGLYMTLGVLLIRASSATLFAAITALSLSFAILLFPLDYFGDWDWTTLTYQNFWTAKGLFKHLFFNGFHPVIPWAAFLLYGIWLGRQDLLDAALRRRIMLVGALVAVVVEGGSLVLVRTFGKGLSGVELELVQALLGTEIIPPMPFYLLAASGTATVVICLSVWLGERFPQALWKRALVHTGQLALTLYVAHVVIGMGAQEELGLIGQGTIFDAFWWTLGFFAVAVVASHLWRLRFKRGPVEALMRKIAG